LIPGFAIDLRASVFRKKRGPAAGFLAFRDRIDDGSAYLFRWGNRIDLSFLQSINPLSYRRVYEEEKSTALSGSTLRELKLKLSEYNPEVLVTHSMGSLMITRYLNEVGSLPSSVRKIVFVQSDTGIRDQIQNNSIISRVSDGDLELIHLYCPWDVTLWLSAIYNKRIPDGLRRRNSSQFRNKHFPLYRRLNLHMSSIADPGIMDLVK
jgi:hypothetical protein